MLSCKKKKKKNTGFLFSQNVNMMLKEEMEFPNVSSHIIADAFKFHSKLRNVTHKKGL